MRILLLSQQDPLEEAMATHSSILFWRTPWTEKPGRQQSIGSQRIRHDWTYLVHIYLNNCIFMLYDCCFLTQKSQSWSLMKRHSLGLDLYKLILFSKFIIIVFNFLFFLFNSMSLPGMWLKLSCFYNQAGIS